MNAAEKAALAKSREKENRILEMFEEAQKYHGEYNPNFWYYDEGTIRSKLEASAAKKRSEDARKKAIKLYTKCAKEGHAESMECLAELSSNHKEAVYWHQKAAERGSIKSMQELISLYETGFDVVQSDAMAQKWAERIKSRLEELFEEAEEKYTECKDNFGLYLDGGETDAAKLKSEDRKLLDSAIKILTDCAKYEHVKSMEVLGEIYKEWMHDKKQTFYWYEEGAKRGSTLCMHTLGVFYRDGIGTNPDSYVSRYYFDMEKRAGNKI